ncbi:MAG TPA: nodulation protein NfeD [candidate division Zixibacteria bacterium]|nr:nodulation protein NfeD [candidate division Zixibacteria bacterium]
MIVIKRSVRFSLALLFVVLMGIGMVTIAAANGEQVLILEVEGPVTPAMAAYFDRAIVEAESTKASAVLIILNTPGGSVDVTLDIVQSFRNSEVPVIVYVAPNGAQAASAGSVIAAAAHAVSMAPETVVGAASPVDSSGADIEATMLRKVTEDLKATMRTLTVRRGEDAVTLAEAMIEEAKAVTASEALEAGFIDVVATDVDDLLRQLDGLTIEVNDQSITLEFSDLDQISYSMSFVERMLHALSNPLLIGILLAIGVQAILIEISSPGGWVAGFVGVLCIGLALYGLGTMPANWFGLILIAVAFVLLLLEVKTPGTGALAAVGGLTLFAGLLVLFNSPGSPSFARISIPGAVIISGMTAGFFLFIVTKALRAQQRQPTTGIEGLLGQVGPVKKELVATKDDASLYRGVVFVNGELWKASSDEAISRGEQVIVKQVVGLTLQVKKAAT